MELHETEGEDPAGQDEQKGAFSFVLAGRSGKNNPWVYVGTIAAVLAAVLLLGQIPLGIAMMSALAPEGGSPDPEALKEMQQQGFNPEALGIHPAWGLVLLVFPFALGILVLALCLRVLHQRDWQTLVRGDRRIQWSKVFFAAALWLVLSIVGELFAFGMDPDSYSLAFDAGKFFPVLVVALLIIPLQSTFEEFVFRGYLLQGISLVAGRLWVGLATTSILFGLMHIFNPEVQQFGYATLLYYMGVGAFLALLTLLDEGAELAIGFHAANNIFGATMVSFPSSAFQMPTLFRIEEYPLGTMLWIGTAASLIYFVILSRRYGPWDFSKLILRIPKTKVIPEAAQDSISDMA